MMNIWMDYVIVIYLSQFIFVTRAQFEELAAPLFQRIENTLQAVLDNASKF